MCHITLTGVDPHHRPKNVQSYLLVGFVADHSTHETGCTGFHNYLVAGILLDMTYHDNKDNNNNDNVFLVNYFIKGCIHLLHIHLMSINLQKYLWTYKKQLSSNFSVKKLQQSTAVILFKCSCVTNQ